MLSVVFIILTNENLKFSIKLQQNLTKKKYPHNKSHIWLDFMKTQRFSVYCDVKTVAGRTWNSEVLLQTIYYRSWLTLSQRFQQKMFFYWIWLQFSRQIKASTMSQSGQRKGKVSKDCKLDFCTLSHLYLLFVSSEHFYYLSIYIYMYISFSEQPPWKWNCERVSSSSFSQHWYQTKVRQTKHRIQAVHTKMFRKWDTDCK